MADQSPKDVAGGGKTPGSGDRPHCYALISSRCGTAHDRAGSDRQDRGLIADVAGDLVVLIADGAGSAEDGAGGAELAVRTALNAIVDARAKGWRVPVDDGTIRDRPEFWTAGRPSGPETPLLASAFTDWATLLSSAMVAAREVVLHHAWLIGDEKTNWATTLIAVVIAGDLVHAAQIGNGYVVIWDDDEDLSRIIAHRFDSDPDPHPATAITSSNALGELTLESATFGPTAHLLVSSDGIAPVLLEGWSPPVPSSRFLRRLTREMNTGRLDAAQLDRFLDSELICSQTDDDKTLALVRRLPLGQSHVPPPHREADPANPGDPANPANPAEPRSQQQHPHSP